jgi:hypothetical protein
MERRMVAGVNRAFVEGHALNLHQCADAAIGASADRACGELRTAVGAATDVAADVVGDDAIAQRTVPQ